MIQAPKQGLLYPDEAFKQISQEFLKATICLQLCPNLTVAVPSKENKKEFSPGLQADTALIMKK